jgi:hypothetical protein
MDKLIFCDIDGVLNNTLFYHRFEPGERYKTLGKDVCDIDPQCVEHLNTLIEETEAKVIISSVWRKHNSQAYLQTVLEKCGFTGEIIGMTPVAKSSESHSLPRGYEIQCWLNDHYKYNEKIRYVIFDDDSDMLWNQREQFIHVDNYAGLTPNHCYRAKNKLNDINFI